MRSKFVWLLRDTQQPLFYSRGRLKGRLGRSIAGMLAIMSLCTACGGKPGKYAAEFDGLFDTHAEIVGYAGSQSEFTKHSQKIYSEMTEYSQLFDIYNNYDGINNLKTVNDNAGIAPVSVDERVIAFLTRCMDNYPTAEYKVNIAMGSVLSIWHEYREHGLLNPAEAELPDMGELEAAALNTDIKNLIIDKEAGTVFLKNKGMSLDVGAAAKGYAIGLTVNEAAAMGMTSALINMGGNIIAVGKPLDGVRERWGVGVQDPELAVDGSANILDTIFVNDRAVVSSGDYQRYYIVDNERYNHIIDPKTLMPARKYASVTVIHADSDVADFLSTALFIADESEGRAMCEKNSAEALWVYPGGKVSYTDGYKAVSKVYGGYSAVDD
ncbi:MAG: FAD:protein FMN transferase [Clostridiales bacterium]|jgi:thiamine biosynthesis lipoprotein|nr:FAD:protein FMN transferase [Clostridiales bacterium]